MSGAYLCGGLYPQFERRRSSIAIAQMSKKQDNYPNDEDEELAQIEACNGIGQPSQRRSSYSGVPHRRISFTFERSRPGSGEEEQDTTPAVPTARRQSCDSSHVLTDDTLSTLSAGHSESVDQTEPELRLQADELWRLLTDWSVDPDGGTAFYWKAAVTMAVIYNCILVISRMAFTELSDEPIFLALDTVCDVIYLLDIVVEARTSFLHEGLIITNYKETLKHYREQPYFRSDLLSVCPTQILLVIVSGFMWVLPCCGDILHWLWDSACWSGVRINRLLKYHTMEEFFHKTESRTNKPNILRAIKLGTHLSLVIHWFACLYYMLSEYEGLGLNDWVYPADTTPVRFSRKYITCMFWSVMTLTTIGERPPPQTEVEYIFTGLTFLIGVFVFAAVVGNVGDVISNMNAARRDFQARMDQIKFYMDHRNVPEHLQNRVKRWAEYTWNRTNCIDEPSVLQLLPDRLRTEVAIHVHLDVLKKVSIFKDCEEGLLRELVLKLRPQIFSPGDYICRIGEIGKDMYIINHGKVEILFPDAETGLMKQVSVMLPGSFFGEISLLKLDEGHNRRTADVRSLGFSELFCLSRRDLIVALAEYPEAKKILEEYGRERYNKTKRNTSLETDDSRSSSPRPSFSKRGSTRGASARTVFERVMKQEGFTKLLESASKNREISEIKAAIEEMRAEKKSVQQLEGTLRERTAELQAARAQLASLENVLKTMTQSRRESTSGGSSEGRVEATTSSNSISGINLAPRWPDLLPASQNSNKVSHRSCSSPKYVTEVSSFYADFLSRERSFFRYRGLLPGPLFVGDRRYTFGTTQFRPRKFPANAALVRSNSSSIIDPIMDLQNSAAANETGYTCLDRHPNIFIQSQGLQQLQMVRPNQRILPDYSNTSNENAAGDNAVCDRSHPSVPVQYSLEENDRSPRRLGKEIVHQASLESHPHPVVHGQRLLHQRSTQHPHSFVRHESKTNCLASVSSAIGSIPKELPEDKPLLSQANACQRPNVNTLSDRHRLLSDASGSIMKTTSSKNTCTHSEEAKNSNIPQNGKGALHLKTHKWRLLSGKANSQSLLPIPAGPTVASSKKPCQSKNVAAGGLRNISLPSARERQFSVPSNDKSTSLTTVAENNLGSSEKAVLMNSSHVNENQTVRNQTNEAFAGVNAESASNAQATEQTGEKETSIAESFLFDSFSSSGSTDTESDAEDDDYSEDGKSDNNSEDSSAPS